MKLNFKDIQLKKIIINVENKQYILSITEEKKIAKKTCCFNKATKKIIFIATLTCFSLILSFIAEIKYS